MFVARFGYRRQHVPQHSVNCIDHREPYDDPRRLIAIGEDRRMQKLLEVVEIWFVLNLATFAFIMWYRRSPSYRRRH